MKRFIGFGPLACGLLLVAVPAAHAEAPDHPAKSSDVSSNIALAQTHDSKTKVGAQPTALRDDELAQLRGQGEDTTITIANQNLTSIVSNPSIGGDLTSGDVSLSDNALSSFNGLGNIVINTGSQVSVQSGMNVTINVNQ
jgi:hypothetical protein